MFEGEVLKFSERDVQTQAVRYGCVNFQCFTGNSLPFVAWHVAHGPHVVRAICQLDQDDAHISRHGQQHFAERLCLVLLASVEFELFELGESVYQFRDGRAELFDQLCLADAAILHGIVHQRCHQRLCVKFPLGTLNGYCNGMCDVGVAVFPELTQMRLIGKAIGFAYAFNVGIRQVVDGRDQRCKTRRSRVGCGVCLG